MGLTNQCGNFKGISVYYSPKASSNILSRSKYIDQFGRGLVKYDSERDVETVNINGIEYEFGRVGGFYAHDFAERQYAMPIRLYPGLPGKVASIASNEAAYTKRDRDAAKRACELMRILGFPSPERLISLINSGVLNNEVTIADVRRAMDIYGPLVPALKGKTVHRTVPAAQISSEHFRSDKDVALYADIMFICGQAFLLSVSEPYGVTLATHLGKGHGSRSGDNLFAAISHQIATWRGKQFNPFLLMVDPERGIYPLKTMIEDKLGVSVDQCGPGSHVPTIERKILTIKQMCRSVLASLCFVISVFLIKHLVLFCVSRCNLFPNARNPIPPKESLTGRKINANIDFRGGFCDYVQTTVATTDNTMRYRTETC